VTSYKKTTEIIKAMYNVQIRNMHLYARTN